VGLAGQTHWETLGNQAGQVAAGAGLVMQVAREHHRLVLVVRLALEGQTPRAAVGVEVARPDRVQQVAREHPTA
jgi:hypothetical protein